jgi:hypothetical protein
MSDLSGFLPDCAIGINSIVSEDGSVYMNGSAVIWWIFVLYQNKHLGGYLERRTKAWEYGRKLD